MTLSSPRRRDSSQRPGSRAGRRYGCRSRSDTALRLGIAPTRLEPAMTHQRRTHPAGPGPPPPGPAALAMDRYTEVLRNDPQNADALYYIAVVACQEGQFQQGIDLARRSLSFHRARRARTISSARRCTGRARSRMRSKPSTKRSTATSTSPTAYGNRANMLSELGRHTEALSSFDRAIALDPIRRATGSTAAPPSTRSAAPTMRWPATTAPSRSTPDSSRRTSTAPTCSTSSAASTRRSRATTRPSRWRRGSAELHLGRAACAQGPWPARRGPG